MADDPVADVLKNAGAPWYVRMGWKLKKGAIMKAALEYLDKTLGKNWKRMAFGVVFITVLVLKALELLFGIHVPVLDSALHAVSGYLATENPDAPVTLEQAQQNSGIVVTALVTGVTGLIALVQPTLRWLLGRKATATSKQPA